MTGPAGDGDTSPHGSTPPRVPTPRGAAEDGPLPESVTMQPEQPRYDHRVLRSLLGAWALSACSLDESLAVDGHLTSCAPCADEALRLRRAVELLHQEESLDLDPLLRARVLESCLGRRPARIPVPSGPRPTTRRPPGSTRSCPTSATTSGICRSSSSGPAASAS